MPQSRSALDFGIGAVGAGFIMRDVQLKAYADAGFNVVGDHFANARNCARSGGSAWHSPGLRILEEMLEDPNVQILDIAVPPDKQLEIVRHARCGGASI